MFSLTADINLNPKVQAACSTDIAKHCRFEQQQESQQKFEAKVLACLRVQFSRRVSLSL